MEAKKSTFFKQMIWGLCLFTIGGTCGYFVKDNLDTNSGANMALVTICHKNGSKWITMSVPESTVSGHMGHGDSMGSCITADPGTPETPTKMD